MKDGHHPRFLTQRSYVLPVDAHELLTQARDHLRLLAQLTEPHGDRATDVVYVSAEALAQCFDRLADDLDRVARAVVASSLS